MRILLFTFSILTLAFVSACTSTSFQIHSPAGLENTKWILDSLDSRKVTTAAGKEITLAFDSNTKNFSGFGGCNDYSGTLKKELDKLTFSSMGSTKMNCDDMKNEMSFFDELPKTEKYDTKNNNLYLFNKSGTIIMVFHSKD